MCHRTYLRRARRGRQVSFPSVYLPSVYLPEQLLILLIDSSANMTKILQTVPEFSGLFNFVILRKGCDNHGLQ
jgi:hypothetical protein